MDPESETSSYDEIAEMYHALWANWYLPAALPALEKLFFAEVPPRARVLDLCCGSGHVTKELVSRGYKVTGIDFSAELIALARRDLPDVDLQVQDVRKLQLEGVYEAAVSTFDSLNHVLHLEELRSVFTRVHAVLVRDGLFVFDLNLDEAYSTDLRRWTVDIGDETIGLVRGAYDPQSRLAATELIWFVHTGSNDLWKRHHSVVKQRCYSEPEVLAGLEDAGFRNIETASAKKAGMNADLGFGRIFFSARA